MTGEELRAARLKADMKQHELGAILGRSDRTISAYEVGKAPIPKAVERVIREWMSPTITEPRSTSIGQAVHNGFEKARADLVKEQELANTILTAKLSRAITGFNRALDLLAAERLKGGISIETAHEQVIKARQEFDAGLAAIDAQHAAKEQADG